MDEYGDYGSESLSDNYEQDLKIVALQNLEGVLYRYSEEWFFTNQESELNDYLKTTIEDNGIQNYEDFEDEEVKSLNFCTLYTKDNYQVIQLPIHFLEPVIDTSSSCKLSKEIVNKLIDSIEDAVITTILDKDSKKFAFLYIFRLELSIDTIHFSLNGVLRKSGIVDMSETSDNIAIKHSSTSSHYVTTTFANKFFVEIFYDGDSGSEILEHKMHPNAN